MKKQQRVIYTMYFSKFCEALEAALKDGWLVVPGTIVITTIVKPNFAQFEYCIAVVEG